MLGSRDALNAVQQRGKQLNNLGDRSGSLADQAVQMNTAIREKLTAAGYQVTPEVDYSGVVFAEPQRGLILAALKAYYQELEAKKTANPIKRGSKGSDAQNALVVLYVDIGKLIEKIEKDKPFADFMNQWEHITKKRCVVKGLMGITTKPHAIVAQLDGLIKTMITPKSAQDEFLRKATVKLNAYWTHLEKEKDANRWFYAAEPVTDKIEAVKKLKRQINYASFQANWQEVSAELVKHRPFTICGIRFSFTNYLFNTTGKKLIDELQKDMAVLDKPTLGFK